VVGAWRRRAHAEVGAVAIQAAVMAKAALALMALHEEVHDESKARDATSGTLYALHEEVHDDVRQDAGND
jgi:hypothetical protein